MNDVIQAVEIVEKPWKRPDPWVTTLYLADSLLTRTTDPKLTKGLLAIAYVAFAEATENGKGKHDRSPSGIEG